MLYSLSAVALCHIGSFCRSRCSQTKNNAFARMRYSLQFERRTKVVQILYVIDHKLQTMSGKNSGSCGRSEFSTLYEYATLRKELCGFRKCFFFFEFWKPRNSPSFELFNWRVKKSINFATSKVKKITIDLLYLGIIVCTGTPGFDIPTTNFAESSNMKSVPERIGELKGSGVLGSEGDIYPFQGARPKLT